ncbi:MAG: TonB-dependent receptor [Pseudomonadota bacterium]
MQRHPVETAVLADKLFLRVSLGIVLAVSMQMASFRVIADDANAASSSQGPQNDKSAEFSELDQLLSAPDSTPDSTTVPTAESASAPTNGDATALPAEPTAQPEALATIPVDLPAKGSVAASGYKKPSASLEEIVVTATKQALYLRDIPASITALSGEDLERSGAQSAEDFIKLVPGVNITSTGDSPPRITIRGIASDIATSSTTGILFGNVSFTDAYVPFVALDPNPFDMASVEVLKGPQGTLFGASALNGAVRYVPTAPQLGVFQVKYFGQYTSIKDGDKAPSYGAAINAPIGETAAIRVMGFKRESPGYIDNQKLGIKDANYLDQNGVRAMLDWHPSDNSALAFTYATQKTERNEPGISDNTDGELTTNNRPRLSYNNTSYDLANLSLRYSFDWADLISESAYVTKDGHNFFDATARFVPQSPIPIAAQEYISASKTYTQELRLSSPTGSDSAWRWIGGASYFRQDIQQQLNIPLGALNLPIAPLIPILNGVIPGLGDLFSASGNPLLASEDLDVQVKELALFGDVTYTFFDDFELSLGGRLYKTTSGGTNLQGGLTILAFYQNPEHLLEGEVKEQGFNPKASLSWHATDDIMAYAAISKGFRVGGLQAGLSTPVSQTPAPVLFKSDTIWNYESGLRTQWFDNTLRFDITGFLLKWTEPQTVEGDASGLTVYIDNVGGVKSVGGEATFEYLPPIEGLKLTVAAGYTKTTTTKEFTTSNGTQVQPGSAWPLSPKWQTATTLSYLTSLSDWRVGASATHTYLGKAVTNLPQHIPIFGYRQWDAQVSLANPNIPWLPEVSLNLNNITNERGTTNQFTSAVTPLTTAVETYYIQPRAVTLRIMGKFGQ